MLKYPIVNRLYRCAAPLAFLAFCLTLSPWLYDLPLNDDWAYALGVRNLLAQGRFVLCDWAASTQLPHLAGGALFAKLFGFSFASLRFYNLAVSAAAVLVFYRTLEEFDIAPADRLLASLVFCLNPLFLVLANSFMTDVTYLFWMTLACWLFIRYLKSGAAAWLAGSGLCAAAACLTRQIGIALPLACTVSLAWERRLTWKNALLIWAFPLAAAAGYGLWFKYVHGPTWASGNYVLAATLKHLSSPAAFASKTLYRLFAVMMETGFVLLPLAAGCYACAGGFPSGEEPKADRKAQKGAARRRAPKSLIVPLALAALVCFILFNGPLPYLENTFSRSGLGTLTLGPAAAKPAAFFASSAFWYIFTALSAVSAALLLGASAFSLRTGNAAVRFVFAGALVHLAVSLAGAKFFDRYILTLLPWFALAGAIAAGKTKFSRKAAAAALFVVAAAGWAGEKDYLQWNKAKWELALKPRPGLAADAIVNGFDYEAWFNYEKNMAYLKGLKPLKMIDEWEWQKVTGYSAMVSFSQRPGFAVADKIEYATPLSREKGTLYLLRISSGTAEKQ